jgi:hypothetical protein
MEKLDNKISVDVHRADLDRFLNVEMTDDQWVALAWNLESLLENAGYNFAKDLWAEIDYLVKEDQED